jgi:ribosomal protein S6--L-glutamate ligase
MKSNAAVISLGSKSSDMVIEAMKKYFDKVDHLNIKHIEVNLGSSTPEMLYEGKPINKYDCIYPKGSFRYSPLLRSLTAIYGSEVFIPFLPTTYTEGHDKSITLSKMQKAKVPIPKTYLTSSPAAAKDILGKVNYPIVMKFPQGTQGKGVMFADSKASASSMMDALSALKQPFLIQEYLDTGGTDIRALVVGNKVVAAMKRIAQQGEQRANIHAGGKGEKVELSEEAEKIAVNAAKAIGAEICGIDMLESVHGPKVIEANLSPGLQGISTTTHIDVADKIAKYLFNRTKELKEGTKKEEGKDLFKKLGISADSEVISTLDFRGTRILLPKIVTEITKFTDKEEVSIKFGKKKVSIESIGIDKNEK